MTAPDQLAAYGFSPNSQHPGTPYFGISSVAMLVVSRVPTHVVVCPTSTEDVLMVSPIF